MTRAKADILRALEGTLLEASSRMAPRLAGMKDKGEISALMRAEFEAAIDSVEREFCGGGDRKE